MAPVPHADDQSDSTTISYSNAIMLTTKDEAKQEAAKKFLAWLLEPETYGRFLTMEPGLFLPVTNDGAKAEFVLDRPGGDQVQVARSRR